MRTTTLTITALLLAACGGGETKPTPAPKTAKLQTMPAKADAKDADAPEKKDDPAADKAATGPTIDHEVEDIDGNRVKLSDYRGKTMLIVNTASECGSTPQYAGLQQLHDKYGGKGLVVLGFPSNDFGEQEPGSHAEIKAFVDKEFGVKFPMFGKVATKGDEQSPLYKTLTEDTPEGIRGEVKWNFTKFLVDPQGQVVARFNTKVEPLSDEVVGAIEKHLPTGG